MRFVSDNGTAVELETKDILTGFKFLATLFFMDMEAIEIRFRDAEHEEHPEVNVPEGDDLLLTEECFEDVFAAVTPGNTIEIMDTEEVLEEFEGLDDDEVDMEIPGLELMISARGSHIIKVNDHMYLAGDTKALVYDIDEDGEMLGLSGRELYAIQKYLERNTVELATEDPKQTIKAIFLK